jgi:hypothetical protein
MNPATSSGGQRDCCFKTEVRDSSGKGKQLYSYRSSRSDYCTKGARKSAVFIFNDESERKCTVEAGDSIYMVYRSWGFKRG